MIGNLKFVTGTVPDGKLWVRPNLRLVNWDSSFFPVIDDAGETGLIVQEISDVERVKRRVPLYVVPEGKAALSLTLVNNVSPSLNRGSYTYNHPQIVGGSIEQGGTFEQLTVFRIQNRSATTFFDLDLLLTDINYPTLPPDILVAQVDNRALTMDVSIEGRTMNVNYSYVYPSNSFKGLDTFYFDPGDGSGVTSAEPDSRSSHSYSYTYAEPGTYVFASYSNVRSPVTDGSLRKIITIS